MDAAVIALASAFGGAVLGAVAGSLGSYWISRHEHAREVRVEIQRELLPDLRDAVADAMQMAMDGRYPHMQRTFDQLHELERAVTTIGRRDWRAFVPVMSAWSALERFRKYNPPEFRSDGAGGGRDTYPDTETRDQHVQELDRLWTELRRFNAWVRNRLLRNPRIDLRWQKRRHVLISWWKRWRD